jgi:osmotically-inducible protein OsmY
MKRVAINFLALGILFTGIQLSACKSKAKTDTTISSPVSVDTTMGTQSSPATVQMAPDDSLKAGVNDAVKDFPGVKASVSNGEITLTGDITRDKLPHLMMAVNSLHPKKIKNNLTIK